jgi:DNA-directed RNA polymerase subunit RPC12/RpoP
MGIEIEGFAFNDYCLQCQKTTVHKIELESKELLGACSSCGEKRALTELKQVHYSNTDLWVTRFKIGNLPSVVAGRLLDAVRNTKRT